MSAVYHELIGKDNQVNWKTLMCWNYARPRAVFTTWLMCHGRLARKNRLKRFNMIKDSSCSLCHNVEEHIAHLYFDCRHSVVVWIRVLDWLKVPHMPKPWHEELKWIVEYTTKKGWKATIVKLAFTETLYDIWRRRNDVIFGNNTHIDIMDNIMDCTVYRGWKHTKIRSHIAIMML